MLARCMSRGVAFRSFLSRSSPQCPGSHLHTLLDGGRCGPKRAWHSRASSTAPITNHRLESHRNAVSDISTAVRRFYDEKKKFRIYHGSTNSTRPRTHSHANTVDTSKLGHVLHVDPEKQTALVEPNVSMDRLVEATLEFGLIPPVVMEFPGITVGGGYAGTSGESSSFRHGFFDRTINYVEMVLADGTVVNCSPTEKPDLFHGAAGALGTLGITTMVEIQLRQAKTYVETTYHSVSSVPEAVEKIQHFTTDPDLDYVDGILFSKTQGAIITGRLTDTPKQDSPIQTFSAASDPWFYLHVQSKIKDLATPQVVTEIIPLAEYLFRYDRGGFWVGRSAFTYFNFPFNRLTRWFLDDFLHTRMMYTALHASGQSKSYIVQDLALPYSTAGAFIDYTDTTFGIYPLWLCPLQTSPPPTMHPHSLLPSSTEFNSDGTQQQQQQQPPKPEQMLNIGLWGPSPDPNPAAVEALNRSLEHQLHLLGGMKWLYAHTYYSESEFWSMFDRDWYDALRRKYGATTNMPTVFDKVKGKNQVGGSKSEDVKSLAEKLRTAWPLAGFYGIWKAIRSRSYLQARKASWRWKG